MRHIVQISTDYYTITHYAIVPNNRVEYLHHTGHAACITTEKYRMLSLVTRSSLLNVQYDIALT